MAETDEKEVEAAEAKNEDKVEEAKDEEKDEEVPVRSKPWSNREARKEFFQAKKAEKQSKEEKSDDEDEELTPQARKVLERELEKRLNPVQSEVSQLRDELAFRDYFVAHPEDRKYQKQAKARFEAWKDVPIEEVMKTIRPSVSAEDKSSAEDKAKRGSMKGGSVRTQEGAGIAKTRKELEEVYRNVKRGNKGEALKALGITD